MTEQFNYNAAIAQELKDLKKTIETQQEALNATYIVIDELRCENKKLKDGLYLRDLNYEIARLKKQVSMSTEAYIKLSERHELLMSKYIRS